LQPRCHARIVAQTATQRARSCDLHASPEGIRARPHDSHGSSPSHHEFFGVGRVLPGAPLMRRLSLSLVILLSAARTQAADPFPGDFSWSPGWGRTTHNPLSTDAFTGEVRLDTSFHYSLARPIDDTITGSSEVFRHGESQVTQAGVGGDFHVGKAHARVMTQFGMYSTTTPRNDPSPARGQWKLADAYRYLSEAYGGYRFEIGKESWVNVQTGIFMSYVGLWSYYNFDNWTYQPSYVSSNTPWFFDGMRVQWFVTPRLKIEPCLVNGWQAYGQLARSPGLGLQVRWNPMDALSLLGNQYWGADTLGLPGRRRVHTDDSVMIRYFDAPNAALSKAAASFTFDAGCESGEGVTCSSQYFVGFMAYHRLWFASDALALTVGGGAISNPGRYLVLLPPINGATASSGTPYFTANPGDRFKAWDLQTTFDVMPSEHVTFRFEYDHRWASVPYFAGHGGVTPPGGNQGAEGSAVEGWRPDLVHAENRLTAALMVKM
jgi:hypothetical protein